MAVPNLEHIVHQVRNSQPWDFTTKEGLCQYSNAVVVALHNADPDFGHLSKIPPQNHCLDPLNRPHAVDVALYKPTGQIVDFIISAGFGNPPPPNTVTWHEGPVGEYGPDKWFAPVSDGTTPNPPPSDDLEDRVAALEAKAAQFEALLQQQQAINEGFQSQITELAKQIADLHQLFVSKAELNSLLPNYFGRLFGFGITSRPVE